MNWQWVAFVAVIMAGLVGITHAGTLQEMIERLADLVEVNPLRSVPFWSIVFVLGFTVVFTLAFVNIVLWAIAIGPWMVFCAMWGTMVGRAMWKERHPE